MMPQYTERELRQKLTFLLAVKKILFGVNFFIWVSWIFMIRRQILWKLFWKIVLKAAGCAAACIGIWFRVERDFTTLIQRIEESDITLTSASILIGANLLISIGAIIAFVGLLGSISVTKENDILLFSVGFSSTR